MKGLLDGIKNNKRMFFSILAILVAVANMFGFRDFEVDANLVTVALALVTLILTFIRNRWDI